MFKIFLTCFLAVTVQAADPLDRFMWKPPIDFAVRAGKEAKADFPYLKAPDQIAWHQVTKCYFALKYEGVVELSSGDYPTEYLKKGQIEFLKKFLAELDEEEATAIRIGDRSPEARPPLRFIQKSLERRPDFAYVYYIWEQKGVLRAEAKILIEGHLVHVGFYSEKGDRMLSQMRLDNFLDSFGLR